MTEYNVTISSKGQIVLPKEVRDQFKLSNGSKVKVIVDGDTIVLKPRSIADELQELVLADIVKDGKLVTPETVKKYQTQLNKALDHMVAEAEQEYNNKEYVSLADLKQENNHV
ncbi:MAG TPA: AbrB/MazE/SpoVT family DNA-binding domain-containing protein [Methylomusa anaerophila]|uniref:SpoVT / AbrB like domain protein n=1 Tax=Methylomusa anaerophila TaxID=1930071 RepID=A0A348AMF1_9FIRM|nr:AbrB/MazE/SpoVT family DNA-binding domain-containing protein [Methylomusa anaerophila]BBB92249.1 SpoVT / AbrB like domain protein [Methylomusa anaerophila]HML90292.1 AbrB/MazE/SpoVT family DNA-binding domain-containing protein [Methylomusa anaerophila]